MMRGMKGILTIITLALLTVGYTRLYAQHKCGTFEKHLHRLSYEPDYKKKFEEYQRQEFSPLIPAAVNDTTIVIPVVVHVIYQSPEQNVSDEQIQSQIDVLNEDFSGNNASSLNIPTVWKTLLTDSKIRFQLAARDPLGNRSNGVKRVSTAITEFSLFDPAIFFDSLGGSTAWPNTQYLNIWVCKIEGNALGFAAYPGTNASEDGVVINSNAFGRKGTVQSPYDYGRTCTHEVGHWLVLNHIWGDDNENCNGRDFPINQQAIDDTPNQAGSTFRCKTFPALDACSPTEPGFMYMNYMDYTDDKCMMFFTPGQIIRMRNTLNGPRSILQSSAGAVLPSAYTHDVSIDSVLNPVRLATERCLRPIIRFKNNGTDTVYGAYLEFGMYGGLQKKAQITKTIPPGASVLDTLPEIGTAEGFQVMEFRLLDNDDQVVNNYRGSGFMVDGSSVADCRDLQVLEIYPNPVLGDVPFTVKCLFEETQESVVRIFDSAGKLMFEKSYPVNSGDEITLQLQGCAAGVYFVQVAGDKYTAAKRLLYLPVEK